MRITLQIALLIVQINLYCQDCQYESYFYWVSRGGIDYSENNYYDATESYKKAFKNTNFPLAADLNLALLSSTQIKDYEFARKIAITLAKGGIPQEYFDQYLNSPWYSELKSKFDEYTEYHRSRFDHKAKKELLKLRHIDSTYNETFHSWRRREIELTLDQLTEGALEVTEGFKSYVNEYGYPSEQYLGYYYKDGAISKYPSDILLIHIYQRGELLYLDRLNQISCDGKMRPTEILLIRGFRGFGNSTGVEQEMAVRFKRFRPDK